LNPWHADGVVQALIDPGGMATASKPALSRLVQEGRRTGLLGRIATRAMARGYPADWPGAMTAHLDAALRVCKAQQAEIRREAAFISQALSSLGAPVVLLKGAAYVLAGLPAAEGRVFGDIDILVPKEVIVEAESMLMMNGWLTTHQTDYDQRYYRQWMHELPPLQHVHRGTSLDVHHAILPETARLRPSSRLLLERSVPLPGSPQLRVLAPADMVLHSMTHLFMNDDMRFGLRDLSDLDLLLRHFGDQPGFWSELVVRAEALDLRRPLYYGLRQTQRILHSPIPANTLSDTERFGPTGITRALMDTIWNQGLQVPHPDDLGLSASAALFALYIRGHWLRMPPLMLARHLATKALQRAEKEPQGAQQPGV
jgi:hypothetical protein